MTKRDWKSLVPTWKGDNLRALVALEGVEPAASAMTFGAAIAMRPGETKRFLFHVARDQRKKEGGAYNDH